MKELVVGQRQPPCGKQVGKKSCNESNIPVWLDHSLLLKCVTVLSHPEADNTHTYCSLPQRLIGFLPYLCTSSLIHRGPISLLPTKTIQKTTIKTGRLSLSFIFTTSFRKKWETHTHTLKTSHVPSHPFLQYSCRVCDPQPEIKQDWRVSHLSGRTPRFPDGASFLAFCNNLLCLTKWGRNCPVSWVGCLKPPPSQPCH